MSAPPTPSTTSSTLSRDRVPLILAAGRTPITEKGKFGARNRYIHWAQEMFDQAGMLREVVKWDYELRVPEQVGDVVVARLRGHRWRARAGRSIWRCRASRWRRRCRSRSGR